MRLVASVFQISRTVFAISALAALAACEGESTPTEPEVVIDPSINQIVSSVPINASNSDTLVYFSFSANAVVPKTAAWDIAVRRYEVRLNSAATAGTTNRGVTAYSLGNNKALTNEQILALTLESTRPAFDSIRTAAIPADSLFKAESLVANNTGYLNLAGAPTANATAYWKVKTTTGHAIVRAAAITLSASNSLGAITLESRIQNGTTLGAAQSLPLTLATTPVHVSLSQNTAVTPNGCNWDLQINPLTFAVITNTACSVGTYPGGSAPTFANQTTASDAPQYAAFISTLAAPIPNSISDVQAPFRYNLLGTSRLHPVFNTYLIKVDTKVYKLQVVNYYSDAGASGYPTLRYARIK